jgi:cyclophilin family peptidyl-prolyl cis-trans isomerase/predicted DsbA family dithiol-disulfide isomerase
MHRLPILLFVITILLSACGPSATVVVPTGLPTITPEPIQPPCNASLSIDATPIPGVDSRFPAVSAQDWVRGPADASVTIVIYNDFQCAECNDEVLREVLKENPKDARLVYRPFPQPDRYDKALLAARAAESAGAQGKFWEMHDLLFDRQSEWIPLSSEQFPAWVKKEALQLGMDGDRFESDLNSEAVRLKIQKAVEDGKAASIPVLPLLLINGTVYSGPKDLFAFNQMVRLYALGKRQFTSCPPMTIDPRRQYIATLTTAKGNIVIELYADKAPLTVNSFVFLARHGWYNGITFHRVIPGFVAQTGDPSGTGMGGPGYLFVNEIDPSLHFNKPGMVGMANSGMNTNGSQFFITYAAKPHLDGSFVIFGFVLSGMDVLEKLTPRDPGKDPLAPPGDILVSVSIEER